MKYGEPGTGGSAGRDRSNPFPPTPLDAPWWVARHHFIREHPQGPPIDRTAVGLLGQHLRRHVLGRATHGQGAPIRLPDAALRQPKVPQAHVAVGIQENVLGFQIPKDDVVPVQILQGQDQFGGVKARGRLAETPTPGQMEEELSPSTVLQHHEEEILRLESTVHVHDEGMRDPVHDFFLHTRPVYLVFGYQVGFPQHFHRV